MKVKTYSELYNHTSISNYIVDISITMKPIYRHKYGHPSSLSIQSGSLCLA